MFGKVAPRIKPGRKIPLAEADRLAVMLCELVRPVVAFSQVVGSVSRRAPEVGDVELVVLPRDMGDFIAYMKTHGFEGGTRYMHGKLDDVKAELWIAHTPEEVGATVFSRVGDYLWQIAMRRMAQRRGLRLDHRGVWKGKRLIFQSPYEEDFFDFLGVDWHEPWERNLATRPKGFKREKRPGAHGPREKRKDICDVDEFGFGDAPIIPPDDDEDDEEEEEWDPGGP